MISRHRLLEREEYTSFWFYWNHSYECDTCRQSLCRVGKDLRKSWKEALDVLNSYEDGTLIWI